MESCYTNLTDYLGTISVTPNAPFPRRIMLESTNNCNHDCVFCAFTTMKRKKQLMNLDFIFPVLERAYACGARECGLHGGAEAFMHPQLHRTVHKLKDIGYTYIYLSTNGTACTQKQMERVLDAGLDSIKFSINAGTAEDYNTVHGCNDFEKAISMVKFVAAQRSAKNLPLKLFVSSVVCRPNQANMDNLRVCIGDLVDHMDTVLATWKGLSLPQDIFLTDKTFTKNPDSGLCMEPFSRMTITAEGYVRICCNNYENDLVVGDLHTQDIESIWHSELYVNIRKAFIEKKLPPNCICHNCLFGTQNKVKPIASLL